MRPTAQKKHAPVSLARALMLVGACVFILTTQHATAQVPTTISGCQTISSGGSYIISQNITVANSADCLVIAAANVTIDGNGKTITYSGTPAFAVNLSSGSGNYSNFTLHDLTTNGKAQFYGNNVNYITIQRVNFVEMSFYSNDHVTVTDSTFQHFVIGWISVGQPALYYTIQRNTFSSSNFDQMVFLNGGAAVNTPSQYTCGDGQYLIEDNTFFSGWVGGGNEPLLLTVRCTHHAVVRRNTFTATGIALGILVRDQSDDGIYSDNTFNLNTAWGGAFFFEPGNNNTSHVPDLDPGDPKNNLFTRNTIFQQDGCATWVNRPDGDTYSTLDAGSNTFSYNYFHYRSGTGCGGIAITISDFGNSFIHNTVYQEATGSATVRFDGLSTVANTVRDNIFSTSGSYMYAYDHMNLTTDLANYYVADHNLFQNRSGAAGFTATYPTLTAWKAASANRDASSIEGDPMFTNPSAGDFSLRAGSPALGAASDGTNMGAWQSSSCTESWSCGNWSACSNNLQTRTCTDANSCGTTVSRPPLSQSCDSTAPTVSITAPTNGATVAGTITVSATASDNVGVAGVQFYLDGAPLGVEDTAAPYNLSWDTTTATNASHTLTAIARDAAGLTTPSSAVTVTVQQTPPVCTENWSCSVWSACTNSVQTRTCTDANHCGTTNTRPPLTQSCVVPDTTPPTAVQDLLGR